jgi:hypothetical protein
VHDRDVRPGQQLLDDRRSLLAVAGQDAVSDTAGLVIGPHDLLAVAQPGRVAVRGRIPLAGIGVNEHRPAFGVGTTGAGRCVGDEQDLLAGAGLAEAAPQGSAALGIRLRGDRVAGLVLPGGPDRV